ncbi:MAG TPA: hypothetical protein VHA75_03970 [Rugosimonospora sp.]|nr:hypothetical protein [Rugosimonospora sp.]
MIETAVSTNFRRNARITFYVVAFVTFILSALVLSHYTHPILGILLGVLIGVVVAIPPALLVFCWPVLRVFLRWWVEIVAVVALVWGWCWLNTHTNLLVSGLVVALLVGAPAAFGPARRFVRGWVMCLVVRHRLRVAFNAFIVANRQGSLPLILHATPTPAGERVWVWLRPGLSLSMLTGQTDKLAVTCWARETTVVAGSKNRAALVRVDVARRNPLVHTVVSPVPDLVPADFDPADAPTSPGMPPVLHLDLPDAPEVSMPAPAATPRQANRGGKPRTAPEPAVSDDGDNNADWA